MPGPEAMSEIKPNQVFTPYCLDLSTNEWVSSDTVIVAPPADQNGKRGTWLVTMDAPPASQDGYTLQMVASDLTGQCAVRPKAFLCQRKSRNHVAAASRGRAPGQGRPSHEKIAG